MTPTYYGGGTGTPVPAPPSPTPAVNPTYGIETLNAFPIELWRRYFGFHPFHFWQVAGSKAPVTASCSDVVYEYNWQFADRAGRDEVRRAIATAEARLTEFLGFAPYPHWVEETIQWPQYPDRRFERLGYSGADRRWISVKTQESRIIASGVETLNLIGTPALVYTDPDGDGIDDTWTITLASALTDASEIAVYFAAADRLDGEAASDRYKIAPVNIAISGGTITIIGKRWQVARPILYQSISEEALDVDVDANFATTLDVYRVTTSAAGQTLATAPAVLIWESRPWPYWAYSYPQVGGDPASYAYAFARCQVHDANLGVLGIGEAVYNATTGTYDPVTHWGESWRAPDRVIVRYKAGVEINRYTELISRLAAAELSKPICACQSANRNLEHWQFDLARTSGANDEAYTMISAADLANPFGTRRGQLQTWKDVKYLRQLDGIGIG